MPVGESIAIHAGWLFFEERRKENQQTNMKRSVVDCNCHIFLPYVNYIVKVKSKHHGFFWIAPLSLSPNLHMGMRFLLFHFHSMPSFWKCLFVYLFFASFLSLSVCVHAFVFIAVATWSFAATHWSALVFKHCDFYFSVGKLIYWMHSCHTKKKRVCVPKCLYVVVAVAVFLSCVVPLTYAACYICAYTIVRCFIYSLSIRTATVTATAAVQLNRCT